MISNIKKFTAQLSFRERKTSTYMLYTQFFLGMFQHILQLSNIIIIAQRNNISKIGSLFLFLLHAIRFEFLQKILPLTVILVLSFSIFIYFLLFRNSSPRFGLFSKSLPIGCALLLIQIEIYLQKKTQSNFIIPHQFFFIILIIGVIWIIKLMALPENYMTKQSKLTKFPALFRTLVFLIQILALMFKINIQIFLQITLNCETLSLIFSLFVFQHISKDLQYLHFLGKYLTSITTLFYLLQVKQILSINGFNQCIPYASFVFLIVSNMLKNIFQKKYNRILSKNNLSSSQIIVLYNLLLNQIEYNPVQKRSIFYFSQDKFVWSIMAQRFFQQQKMQKYPQQLEQTWLIKTKFQCGEPYNLVSNSQNFSLDIEYILIWLERQQMKYQSELLTLYLCFSYLSQQKYLKSIQCLMKSRKTKNFEGKQGSIYQLIHFELQNYKNICKNMNIIVQKQKNSLKTCVGQQYKAFLELNHIDCIQMQLQLQELIRKIGKLFNTINSLVAIMSNTNSINISSRKIKEILLEQIIQKQQIRLLIEKMHAKGHQNRKFIFIYYVYLNVCCSQTFTLFQKLQPLLEVTNENKKNEYIIKKASENDMMVMVSIEDEYIGVIEHANIIMKSFFSLKQDKISSKTEHIQKIIPKFIASRHNELMMKFKKTGNSNMIGRRNRLIVIQNQQRPYEVNIDIKLYVSLDCNISLTSRIMLLKEQTNIVLFSAIGQVFENSLDLSMTTSIKRKSNSDNLNFLTLINSSIETKLQKIKPHIFNTNFKQKLAKITIQTIEIKGNHLGICKIKFLNRNLIPILSNLDKGTQKNINSLKSLEKQSNCRLTSQELKFMDLELRIWDMKNTHQPHQLKIKCLFLIFLIVTLCFVGYSFNYIQSQFINSSINAGFYNIIINGFHTRFFQMNNRFLLLYAINTNIIPDNIASPYNISSFSEYIKDTTLSYSMDYDKLDAMMITYSAMITNTYMHKFINPMMKYYFPYNFSTSWISVLSLMKSFYRQSIFQTEDMFNKLWQNYTVPFTNYLTNQYFLQMNDNIYMDIIDKNIVNAKIIGDNINALIYSMDTILFILFILVMYIFNNVHNQTQECISLLMQLDVELWKKKGEKIKLVKESMIELTQTMIVDQDFQPQFGSIKYYLKQGNHLVMQHGEIYFQQNNQQKIKQKQKYLNLKQVNNIKITNIKKQNKSKKQFQRSGFLKTHIYCILTITILSVPMLAMLMWSLTLSNQIYAAIKFFYDYQNAIGNFRISQSIMFNIVTSKIVLQKSPYINLIDATYWVPTMNGLIFKRTHEDILKQSLSWDMVSDLLYKSNCDQADELCKTLISGSLNKNTPSAIMQFNNIIFTLFTNTTKNLTSPNRNSLLCQLWLTYQIYLRPIILIQQTEGLDMTKFKLQTTQNQMRIIFQKIIIPFMVIFLSLSYVISHRMYQQLQNIKKEILMSDKVENLITKVKFWNHLINLK